MKRARPIQPQNARAKPGGRSNYCFWSIADGEFALMAETMVASARRVGVTTEFHIWSDDEIAGATVHPVSRLKKDHYLFKLEFLRDRVSALPHEYFVWLDADSYFVRDPGNVLRVLGGAPMHASLESDLCAPGHIRTDWRGCPLPIYTHLMREAGVRGESIFNVNGGFWIVHRDVVKEFCDMAFRFWELGRRHGYLFTEEAPIAFAAHMLCRNRSAHLLRRWTDLWVTDWLGAIGNKLPDGKPWVFRDYFSFEAWKVNPAIVHAVSSKELLVAEAQRQRSARLAPAADPPKKQAVRKRLKPAPPRDNTPGRSASGSARRGTR